MFIIFFIFFDYLTASFVLRGQPKEVLFKLLVLDNNLLNIISDSSLFFRVFKFIFKLFVTNLLWINLEIFNLNHFFLIVVSALGRGKRSSFCISDDFLFTFYPHFFIIRLIKYSFLLLRSFIFRRRLFI